jgi:3-oxoadipate enol-lactonase
MPFAELKEVRLHYEVSGSSGRPVIVLVNSLGSSLKMWEKILPALANSYRVLQYDARGHGLSSVPSTPYTLTGLSNDLLDLLDYLAIDRVHLCGLSLGGLVGMWLGIHRPRRINRLILANTAARVGTREGWDGRIDDVRKHGMSPIARASLDRWITAGYQHEHPEESEAIGSMIESTPAEGYIGCCCALRDADLRPAIAAIDAPCLVITGIHDPATPPEDGRFLHGAVKQSHYVELDAAHLSAWERSQEFQQSMMQFLNKQETDNG